jgi:D-apionolactonase
VSDAAAVDALRRALDAAGLTIPVVGGARSHFTELNREQRRLPTGLDGIAVTVTPLFHATGTEQLVESLAMQRLVALQTVEIGANAPVHVGPVTLRPRFNNVATGPQPAPTRDDLSEGYGAAFTGGDDGRQDAPELAAWTVASAAALAVPGVASLAWFEEWGPRGIRGVDGAELPAADAVAALASLAGGTTLWGESPDGLVWALGARGDADDRICIANLDVVSRAITVSTDRGTVRVDLAPGAFTTIALSRGTRAS